MSKHFPLILSVLLSIYMASTAYAEATTEEADQLDKVIDNLNADIGAEEKGENGKQATSPEVDKYLKGEDGYTLYRDLNIDPNKKGDFETKLRKDGIVDTARSFGAQAGLHWRYKKINELVMKYEGRLDAVNFKPFITDGLILVPSILIVRDDEHYQSPQKMVKSNISFVVHQEARIVSVAPTFRNYLLNEFLPPRPVNAVLKPKNDAESKIWRVALQEGWDIGVKEANEIFFDGLLRLERDIEGRVNFRKMVQLGMISPAALKVTKKGVTFNGRTMSVGETIFEITENANFRTMDEWRSAWLKNEGGEL